MNKFSLYGFAVFLCVYSYFKYVAVPNLMGTPQYIFTTIVLVALTAIIPFFISYWLSSGRGGLTRNTILGLTPLILCTAGLATYFFLFIAPNAPGMSVLQVLPRAVVPGIVMGALLLIPHMFHQQSVGADS